MADNKGSSGKTSNFYSIPPIHRIPLWRLVSSWRDYIVLIRLGSLMGNTQHTPSSPTTPELTISTEPSTDPLHDFERRWKTFLNSLDISSGKLKDVELLEKDKKLELLLNFEAKNPQHPVSHYIQLIKNIDWNLLSNPKKKDVGDTLRSLLSSTDISLRTNSVQWVYDFLQNGGLDILTEFMSTCLELLCCPDEHQRKSVAVATSSVEANKSKSGHKSEQALTGRLDHLHVSVFKENASLSTRNGDHTDELLITPQLISAALNHKTHADNLRYVIFRSVKLLLKNCLHLSLRCLKTILNNQHGCKKSFENPQVIGTVIVCLLLPNHSTKTLALDILTALCLIEGGHIKVLQAFDRFRQVMSEGLRFEMLFNILKYLDFNDTESYYYAEFALSTRKRPDLTDLASWTSWSSLNNSHSRDFPTCAVYNSIETHAHDFDKVEHSSDYRSLNLDKASATHTVQLPNPVPTNTDQACRLAEEASNDLIRLIQSIKTASLKLTSHSPMAFHTISPINWIPTTTAASKFQGCLEETLFHPTVIDRSLSLHPLPTTPNSVFPDTPWRTWSQRLDEPWSSVVSRIESAFQPMDSRLPGPENGLDNSPQTEWLSRLNLIPTQTSDRQLGTQDRSVFMQWPLYVQLIKLRLDCIVAQRLCYQLLSPQEPQFLHSLESALAVRYPGLRNPEWSYLSDRENRWFWTTSFLRIVSLWQLWPVEVVHLTESLSTLLTGCSSILVNSKLPIVFSLVLRFASRVTANWSADGFTLQSLDALTDWHLKGLTTSTRSQNALSPPINGGPPAYTPTGSNGGTTGSQEGNTNGSNARRSSASCLRALVQMILQEAPQLSDWPSELGDLNAVARVSLEDISNRIQTMETVYAVWHTILMRDANLVADLPEGFLLSMDECGRRLPQLRHVTEAVRQVSRSTAEFLQADTSLSADWLSPLCRFTRAFQHHAINHAGKRRLPVKDQSAMDSPASGPQRRTHRRNRNEAPSDSSDKRQGRHRKHRTRQLDTDGVMDDILAGLTSQPLRADVHTKRKQRGTCKVST